MTLTLAMAVWSAPLLAKPPPADALTVEIQLDDLERFVALFERTDGSPTAEDVQREYLDPGSYGIEVFTPARIVNAKHLAEAVAANPQVYRKAIEDCLPHVRSANRDLRSIYLGLRGVFPDATLPQVFVLFGAGNSGGTAAKGAQVLGLEVICAEADTPEELRHNLRHFFAHETVHALQRRSGRHGRDILLETILAEGAADFIARMVTGEEPDLPRAQWAQTREADLVARLDSDMDTVATVTNSTRTQADAAVLRWVHNYGAAPDGWPSELGYWMGLRIWEGYWAQTEDKQEALSRMLTLDNPREILAVARTAPLALSPPARF